MERASHHWIEFLAPGSFIADSWKKAYEPPYKPEHVEFPERAYAFTMHKQDVIVVDGNEFLGKSEQIGPTYYHPDSKIETLEQVLKRGPESILAGNMKCNKWDKVIFTRWDNWPQPYKESETVVLPTKD